MDLTKIFLPLILKWKLWLLYMYVRNSNFFINFEISKFRAGRVFLSVQPSLPPSLLSMLPSFLFSPWTPPFFSIFLPPISVSHSVLSFDLASQLSLPLTGADVAEPGEWCGGHDTQSPLPLASPNLSPRMSKVHCTYSSTVHDSTIHIIQYNALQYSTIHTIQYNII